MKKRSEIHQEKWKQQCVVVRSTNSTLRNWWFQFYQRISTMVSSVVIQWNAPLMPNDAYIRQYSWPSLVQIMAWRLAGAKAIIRTNAGMLIIGPLKTNFSEILIEIYTFSFQKMHLKMSSGIWRPFFLGFNVLRGVIKGVHLTYL